MFGFSLATQLFQGSALRTWNCVTQFTNLLWDKFNHIRHPIMPRSRRRHHSRSSSRSRSHSQDRDREPKRRKIEGVESPLHKKSVSCEPSSPAPVEECDDKPTTTQQQLEDKLTITPKKTMSPKQVQKKLDSEKKRQLKQQERDRLKMEKMQEKEEMKQKLNEQKAKEREMRRKEKEEKEEQRRKEKEEKEAKRKEKEEREEAKRKEKEEREEAKRREKEEREEARKLEKLKRQQELEEKNKEKLKMEEQKQKAAQAFKNFFVPKKQEAKTGEERRSIFMPFQVKSDMRMAPVCRASLSDDARITLEAFVSGEDKKESPALYLDDLKGGKVVGKSEKTFPCEEDVVIVDEEFGDRICEEKLKVRGLRAKFLKFRENQRPAYYGTWRKKSAEIKGRRPFAVDAALFDYEVDSDDDWEEEEQGESLNGSDDEDKENEAENDEYEVDNEFFVPHGHLSDDEVDEEAISKLSPESQKQKLKLLKDEFDLDMRTKTNRMKPRSIGCIWYKKDGSNVDEAIDKYLRPLAAIANGQIVIKKRGETVAVTPNRKSQKELQQELVPAFLKIIDGNVNNKQLVIKEFMDYMRNNGYAVEVSKRYLCKQLKEFAQWKKCNEEGAMFNKFCWCVDGDVKSKFNVVD